MLAKLHALLHTGSLDRGAKYDYVSNQWIYWNVLHFPPCILCHFKLHLFYSQPCRASATGLSIVSKLTECVSCCFSTRRSFSLNPSNEWRKNKYQGFMSPLETNPCLGDSTFQRLRNPRRGTSGPTCTVVGPLFRLIYNITNQTVHK